jgi:hypothetical protein
LQIEPLEQRQMLSLSTLPLLTSSANPSNAGANVTLTASMPADATGTVTFDDGSTALAAPIPLSGSDALQFDGSSGSVSIPVKLSNRSAWTFTAWVNEPDSGSQVLYSESNGTGNQAFIIYLADLGQAGELRIWDNNQAGNNPNGFSLGSKADFPFNQWVDVTITYADNTLSYYRNGTPIGSVAATFQDSQGTDFRLGSGYNNSQFLDGFMDEVMFFDHAISGSDARTLYNGGTGVYGNAGISGLLAGYHFDEGSGTSVADFSGYGNNGTLHGGVTWVAGKIATQATQETASFTTAALAAGTHSITAVYSGDANYAGSTSETLTQVVTGATDVSLTASPSSSALGQNVTLTATLPAAATGSVTFDDNGNYLAGPINVAPEALQFDGSTGSVSIPVKLSDQTAWTFTAWVNEPDSGSQVLYSESNGTPDQSFIIYLADLGQTGELRVWNNTQAGNTGCGGFAIGNSAGFPFNQWVDVAITYEDDTLSYYQNGGLVGSVPAVLQDSQGTDFRLGSGYNNSQFLDGSMDEPMFFDHAISGTDAITLYNGGSGVYGNAGIGGLVAGYHFDEGAGTTVHDFSGNGHDGTLNGGVTWVPSTVAVAPQPTASFTTEALPAGTNDLTAVYSGDANNAGGTSNDVMQVAIAPLAVNDSYNADTGFAFTVPAGIGVLANDTYDPNATITVTYTQPQDGTLTLANDGSFQYTANAGYTGMDSFTYQISDGFTASNWATVTLAVYLPPVAMGGSYTTLEGTAVSASAPGLLANDTSSAPGTLAAVLDSNASDGSVTVNADGSFSYTPNSSFAGTDSFTYSAFDGLGYSNPATVTVAVNYAPVAANQLYQMAQGGSLSVAAPGLLEYGQYGPNGTMSISIVPGDGPNNGTVALDSNNDGGFTYTPGSNYYGTDGFTYQISDGTNTSPAATATIVVYSTPEPNPDAYSVGSNSPLVVSATDGVLANDYSPCGDTLTAAVAAGPSHGILSWSADGDGSFTYTPTPGYYGPDSFTYVAADSSMSTAAALPCTVWITVYPVPVVQDDTYVLSHDAGVDPGTLTVPVANGVLANDSDPAGNTLSACLILGSGPADGSLQLSPDGSFSFEPNTPYDGWTTDTFTYTADNGIANSAPATVTIQLNTAPVAADDGPYLVNESMPGSPTTLTVPAANGVLANDTDADGNSLTAILVPGSGPADGSLTLGADGSFAYTPNPGFFGADSFSYCASDGYANSNSATCHLYVVDPSQAPQINWSSSIQPPAVAGSGQSFQISGSVACQSSSYTVAVDFGDGNGPQQATIDPNTNSFSTSYTYATTGGYTISLTATDTVTGLTTTYQWGVTVVPTVSLSENPTLTEVTEGNTAYFTVKLSSPATQDLSVQYAAIGLTAGADYDPGSSAGVVTIPAGQDWATIAVNTIDNEPNSAGAADTYFSVSLVNENPMVTYAADGSTAEGVIHHNGAVLGLEGFDATAGDTGTVTVTLSQPMDHAVTFSYDTSSGTAFDGTDYTGISGTGVIYAGSTSATFSIATLVNPNNAGNTGSVYFYFTISSVQGIGPNQVDGMSCQNTIEEPEAEVDVSIAADDGANPEVIIPGIAFSGYWSFTGANMAGPYSAFVDYGDGTSATLSVEPNRQYLLGHTFSSDGLGNGITVTVTDGSGVHGSATLQTEYPTATILRDGVALTGSTQQSNVGDMMHLSLDLGAAAILPWNYQWWIPGSVVAGYQANGAGAEYLQDTDYNYQTIDFAWVAGGTEVVDVSATWNGFTVQSQETFTVSEPSCSKLTATVDNTAGGQHDGCGNGPYCVSLWETAPGSGIWKIGFEGANQPGIKFSATGLSNWSGFNPVWCQVVNTVVVPSAGLNRSNLLDTSFPYPNDGFNAKDSPESPDLTIGAYGSFDATFTMWLMCQSTDADSIPVPLYCVNWSIEFTWKTFGILKPDGTITDEYLSITSETATVGSFQSTTNFPQWIGTYP